MNQRLLLRVAIILLVAATAMGLMTLLRQSSVDPSELIPGNSQGMIAALKLDKDGSQVVVFDSNGKMIEVPGYMAGRTDREPVWRPDGQRLFFASDRKDKTFQIFRWIPGREEIEQRSLGTRPKNTPWFGPAGYEDINSSALMTSSGTVIDYLPRTTNTYQVLPPPSGSAAQSSGDEKGVTSALEASYSRLGKSFRKARYGPNRDSVTAIMRNDQGEVVFYQSLAVINGQLPPPAVIASGEQLDFEILQDGKIFVSVVGLSIGNDDNIPEEFIKNGKVILPYENALFIFDPMKTSNQAEFIFVSKEAKLALINPVVSPNNERLLVTQAERDANGILQPIALRMLDLPLKEDGNSTVIAEGSVFEATFTPQSDRILYVKNQSGFRGIYRNDFSGSSETLISPKGQNFAFPTASPMEASK